MVSRPVTEHDHADDLRFACSSCSIILLVPRRLAGAQGPCPHCGARVTSPSLPAKGAEPRARARIGGLPQTPSGRFVAKNRIAAGTWGQDDSWKRRVEHDNKRWAKARALDKKVERVLSSSLVRRLKVIVPIAAVLVMVGGVAYMDWTDWGTPKIMSKADEEAARAAATVAALNSPKTPGAADPKPAASGGDGEAVADAGAAGNSGAGR